MGMYTELNINVNLCENMPQDICDTLKAMLANDSNFVVPASIANHPLFKSNRWRWMLVSTSCYFDGLTRSAFCFSNVLLEWQLTIRCNLKNYDGEIEKFLDLLSPYISTEDFLGYMRYEEDIMPTLIFKNSSTQKIIFTTVTNTFDRPLDNILGK